MTDKAERLAHEDAVFGKFNQLLSVLNKEKKDERALVLSIAAFSEECLGRLLKAYMRDVKSAADIIEGFNAPLGTFSSRIKACHALGLLKDSHANDFEHIRKIRNEFAHSWVGVDFTRPSIASRLAKITPGRLGASGDGSERGKLVDAFASNLVECEVLIGNIAKHGNKAKVQAVTLSTKPLANDPPKSKPGR
ncbi:hypothetical protein [Agrobacterium tumefaciens]|uniref:hypothetical protein n=1 Tax=Agrobacterium tumefaciens TaxID=358 RepID=UPI00047034E0